MRRALYSLYLCAALASIGCVDVVQSGAPPLVQGCSQDTDCPFAFICNDGSCEEFLCVFYCDGGAADGLGGAPSFSGCPGAGFGCLVAPEVNPASGSPFAYCARGVPSTACQCERSYDGFDFAAGPDAGYDFDAGPFYCDSTATSTVP